jgi:hypothetical protein
MSLSGSGHIGYECQIIDAADDVVWLRMMVKNDDEMELDRLRLDHCTQRVLLLVLLLM